RGRGRGWNSTSLRPSRRPPDVDTPKSASITSARPGRRVRVRRTSSLKDRSLDAIFRPRSVAVGGAARRPGSIGSEILGKLLEAGFEGAVYPVNPHTSYLHSI